MHNNAKKQKAAINQPEVKDVWYIKHKENK